MYSNRLITPIILLLASAGLFFGFIRGQYAKNLDLKKEVLVYQDALEKAKQLTTLRDGLVKKKEAIGKDNLEKLGKLMPDNVDTVRMVSDLNGIADNHGILVKTVKLANPQDAKVAGVADTTGTTGQAQTDFDKASLSFTLTTSYDKFSNFLTDLERSLRILDVTSIILKPVEKDSTLYDFTVNASTYWLK
ncbi:MAG: hypothetical protein ABI430_02050 [Candidatus Taylorbacteria bacterium]